MTDLDQARELIARALAASQRREAACSGHYRRALDHPPRALRESRPALVEVSSAVLVRPDGAG